MKKGILIIIAAIFLILPRQVEGQASSDLLAEYIFPIKYGTGAMDSDVIGLRIYKNLDNLDPLTWYQNNVINPKSSLTEITVDGYKGVRDERTVYVQASNLVNLDSNPVFYTNIYVLAYNQNASADTVNIYNQMLANLKFNKNIMDLYCLKAQSDIVKEKLRRDTLRKVDLYKLTNLLRSAPSINLRSGTYVPGMSISTWPSWQENLGRQLGATLPVDPLNIMADKVIGCTKNEQCETGQCSGGYCSACKQGWHPKTCWNEKTQEYQDVDGFVYKYRNGVLTIRYEWPQLVFPQTNGECFLGCDKGGAYYVQGSCYDDNTYCNAGVWVENKCGDNMVRCNEVCDCDRNNLADCGCKIDCVGDKCTGCLTCKEHYHAVGSLCEPDIQPVETLSQTLSIAEERRWTGSSWSDPYATACKANAILDNDGVCKCKKNYHEESGQCVLNQRYHSCGPLPANAVWNTVSGYEQNWDGEKWVPIEKMARYDETPTTNACHYKCGENAHREGDNCICDQYFISVNNICSPDLANPPIYTCQPDKPANTVWNNGQDRTFPKTYTNGSWQPLDGSLPTEYNITLLQPSCHYKCAENFVWNGTECQLCGNGQIDPGEDCDGTAGISASPPESSITKQYGCDSNCHFTGGYLGDGVLQSEQGEVCDTDPESIYYTRECSDFLSDLPEYCSPLIRQGTQTCNGGIAWGPCVLEPPDLISNNYGSCSNSAIEIKDSGGYSCCKLNSCHNDTCCEGKHSDLASVPSGYIKKAELYNYDTGEAKGSCVLSQSESNPRFWIMSINHTTGGYQCWR